MIYLSVMQSHVDKFKQKLDLLFIVPMKILKKAGVTPDMASGISLFFGLLAVYFLFSDDYLFALFILLHLLFDKLDGVMARHLKKATKKGEMLDYIIDTFVGLLLIAKSLLLYKSPAFAALLFFSLHHGIFLLNQNRKTLFGSRTFLCLLYIFKLYYAGLIAAIICSAAGLVMQAANSLSLKRGHIRK